MIYFQEKNTDEMKKQKAQTEAARKLLLLALAEQYGIRTLPAIAKNDQGKPYFPEYREICFNYSHCRKGILCGIGRSGIGVDIETVREWKEPLIRRVCHAKEQEALAGQRERNLFLTDLWSAKEAYLKYLGAGLRCDLRLLDLSGLGKQKRQGPDRCGFYFRDLQTEDGCTLRLWNREGLSLCACSREKEALELKHIFVA